MKKRIHIDSFKVPGHDRHYKVSLKGIRIKTKNDIDKIVKIANDRSIPEKDRLIFLSNSLPGTYEDPYGKIKVTLMNPKVKNGIFKAEGMWAGKYMVEKNKTGGEILNAIRNILALKKHIKPEWTKGLVPEPEKPKYSPLRVGEYVSKSKTEGGVKRVTQGKIYEISKDKNRIRLQDIYGNKSKAWYPVEGFKIKTLRYKDIDSKVYHIVKGRLVEYKSSRIPDEVAVFKGKEQMSKKFHKMYGTRDHIKKAKDFIRGTGSFLDVDFRKYKIVVVDSEARKYGYYAY